MGMRCIIIFYWCMGLMVNWCDDVVFGDDFYLVVQCRVCMQSIVKDFFGVIVVIDVGLIKGGDVLVQICLDFCFDMCR